jgi:hypothetical protein
MTSFLDKLNLRPAERRLVVIVALVVFVVLNIWLIWPQFGSVATWQKKRGEALKKLQNFNDEVKKKSGYEKQLRDLESQGAYVGTEEQAIALSRDVANQATLSGVQVNRFDPAPRSSTGRTNAFFEEQTLIISIANTGEKELVDFLYNLGARSSLIRVKSMTVSPDPTRMKLQGSITLVASFAKKPPPRVSAPPKATNQPPPKAAPTPTKATNAPPPRGNDPRRPSTTKT